MKNNKSYITLRFRCLDSHWVEVTNYLHYAAKLVDILAYYGITANLPDYLQFMRIKRPDNIIIEYRHYGGEIKLNIITY